MEESCEMPDLLNIFSKIVCDKKKYCFVCLRTSDERRLVKPESFNKFLIAAKVNTNSNILSLCYLCERQAKNALKLLHAAMFASTLSRILTELCRRNITPDPAMLEKKFFNKILAKVQLSKTLSPKIINEEVERIRKNYHLTETETLVMDNEQVYEAEPTQTVVAVTTLCQPQPPAILPDRQLAQDQSHGNQVPPPPETYVILDDEDDPLAPTSTANNKEPPQNHNILNSVMNLADKLVITLEPPSLVTFEHLLADQTKLPTDYILYPIFLTDSGDLSVPSLSAVIKNDALIFQDTLKQTIHSRPLKINTQIVEESLKQNREVFIQVFNNFQLPVLNSNLVNQAIDKSCERGFPMYPQKKLKIDGTILHNELFEKKQGSSSSKTGNNSKIKQVIMRHNDEASKSNNSGSSKTDWEDKIPMDVISFVDAVDPNAHQVLKERESNNSGFVIVGNVRSLAEKGVDHDIIDLC